MTTMNSNSSVSLEPVLLEIEDNGTDGTTIIFNADEMVAHLMASEHPNTGQLMADFNEGVSMCRAEFPALSLGEVKYHVLAGLLLSAYGLDEEAAPAVTVEAR